MKLKLELMNGARDGDEFRVRKTSIIGREKNSELSLSLDKYVSRRHAKLIIEDPKVFLEDLGSTNGTFYDGERLEGSTPLDNGDYFRVGRTWMQITW